MSGHCPNVGMVAALVPWKEPTMFVVSNSDTGYSDESMRFATWDEAVDWVDAQPLDQRFTIREEA